MTSCCDAPSRPRRILSATDAENKNVSCPTNDMLALRLSKDANLISWPSIVTLPVCGSYSRSVRLRSWFCTHLNTSHGLRRPGNSHNGQSLARTGWDGLSKKCWTGCKNAWIAARRPERRSLCGSRVAGRAQFGHPIYEDALRRSSPIPT